MSEEVGVGPHPEPWPVGEHFDPELLRDGDRRNVIDRYRYWSVEAISADLDARPPLPCCCSARRARACRRRPGP